MCPLTSVLYFRQNESSSCHTTSCSHKDLPASIQRGSRVVPLIKNVRNAARGPFPNPKILTCTHSLPLRIPNRGTVIYKPWKLPCCFHLPRAKVCSITLSSCSPPAEESVVVDEVSSLSSGTELSRRRSLSFSRSRSPRLLPRVFLPRSLPGQHRDVDPTLYTLPALTATHCYCYTTQSEEKNDVTHLREIALYYIWFHKPCLHNQVKKRETCDCKYYNQLINVQGHELMNIQGHE